MSHRSRVLVATIALLLAVQVPLLADARLPDVQPRQADFSVSCSPSTYTITAGTSASGTCTVSSTGGFSQPVTLDCFGASPGITCAFAPNPVTPPAGGSVSSTITISVASSVTQGQYNFHVRGTSGTQRFFIISVIVNPSNPGDFSVSCSPQSYTVAAGGSTTGTCTVTSQAPFSAPVTLSCFGPPAGISCAFAPNPVTPPAGGSVSSTITISAAAGTSPATYSFNVRGTDGARDRFFNIFVTVTSPPTGDFSVNCTPFLLTVPAGGSGTTTCTVQSTAPFAGPVTWDCVVPTPSITCVFAPPVVTPPSGGTASSVLTVSVAAGTQSGVYGFAARGTSGSLQRMTQLILFVT